jgi:hypothetical protein
MSIIQENHKNITLKCIIVFLTSLLLSSCNTDNLDSKKRVLENLLLSSEDVPGVVFRINLQKNGDIEFFQRSGEINKDIINSFNIRDIDLARMPYSEGLAPNIGFMYITCSGKAECIRQQIPYFPINKVESAEIGLRDKNRIPSIMAAMRDIRYLIQ